MTTSAAQNATTTIISEEFFVPFMYGVDIYVHNKRPAGVEHFSAERIAIMIPGATYPSNSFDMPFDSKSWMDHMAEWGFDTYRFDFPGYGQSTRPGLMDKPPELNLPYMRSRAAVQVLRVVVDFVLKRRQASQVNLIGWCWGGKLGCMYAGDNPAHVRRLVLYGPRYSEEPLNKSMDKLGAYRVTTRDEVYMNWRNAVGAERMDSLIPKEHVSAWLDAIFSTDPKGHGQTMRVPNGNHADMLEIKLKNKDPERIYAAKVICPTFVIGGEWDHIATPQMLRDMFALLTNVAWKKIDQINNASHYLFLERDRLLLYRSIRNFLEESAP